MTLPQPGQWVTVPHACDPDTRHDTPVQVLSVVPITLGHRIVTRRCDGRLMHLYAHTDGTPADGDPWQLVQP